MADGRHIGNQKFAIFFYNRTTDRDEILHEHADSGCKPCEKFKFAHFRNSRWRTAAILEMENSPYLCSCVTNSMKFCMNMQIVAVNRAKS